MQITDCQNDPHFVEVNAGETIIIRKFRLLAGPLVCGSSRGFRTAADKPKFPDVDSYAITIDNLLASAREDRKSCAKKNKTPLEWAEAQLQIFGVQTIYFYETRYENYTQVRSVESIVDAYLAGSVIERKVLDEKVLSCSSKALSKKLVAWMDDRRRGEFQANMPACEHFALAVTYDDLLRNPDKFDRHFTRYSIHPLDDYYTMVLDRETGKILYPPSMATRPNPPKTIGELIMSRPW